ncbi:2TM domain-containing protein [Spongiimicrobium salis]|uniref:2TM domain-containing protein n=1 Tax=Spongiimicrobium salis TaxID=1667022 RepID=UPI00374D479C
MDYNNTSELDKKQRAKKRVDELKGFYIHALVYILVNSFISISKIVNNIQDGESFIEAFWDFGTGAVWFFWGIGLLIHGLNVFSYNPFFNKAWEERQIQKYIEEDEKASRKYR